MRSMRSQEHGVRSGGGSGVMDLWSKAFRFESCCGTYSPGTYFTCFMWSYVYCGVYLCGIRHHDNTQHININHINTDTCTIYL